MHKDDSSRPTAPPCPIYHIPIPALTIEHWLELHCQHNDPLYVYKDEQYGVIMLTNARTQQMFVVKEGHCDDAK
jgi:hypothetical protein